MVVSASRRLGVVGGRPKVVLEFIVSVLMFIRPHLSNNKFKETTRR